MNLDDKKIYEKFDPGLICKSIELLPDQIRQVLDETHLIKIPSEYSQVTQVVISGMGGSNIGGHIVKSIFADQIKVPVTIEPGYFVPANVNAKTLYLISSYSGSTEEPLSTYLEAKKRGAKILGITADNDKSDLKKLMMKDDIPGYCFKAENNPSRQPRLGLGYSVFGIAVLLAKAGLLKIETEDIKKIIAEMEIRTRKLRNEMIEKENMAKQIASKLVDKIPVLIGADHTIGNIHALRNHLNENSKTFSTYFYLPDLNHHLLEGLAFPKSNRENLALLFFDSALYHPRVQKRSELTKQVVAKNNVEVITYKLQSETRVGQGFELLQVGVWISYYLGMLNKVNPCPIPYVDWFKEQLDKFE